MSLASQDAVFSCFSYENLQNLTDACVSHYNKSLAANDFSVVQERRSQLANYVRLFHRGSGTLTPRVEEAIKKLEEGSGLLLMAGHQPNLFAYSGVLRKATLNHVLAKRLSERLRMPVLSFFGIADQDFADDRWVKSALLPDVERRDGFLKLHFDTPEKLMMHKVAKPERKIMDAWQDEIRSWIFRELNSVRTVFKSLGNEFEEKSPFSGNFEAFWSLVEEAYERAESYSDFNAYLMSKIVNNVWEYDTIFSRFSECQQIFEREFSSLLSNFDKYSLSVEEASCLDFNTKNGVHEKEFETIPFWYHCDCGSKVKLKAEKNKAALVGKGRCIRCEKEYQLDFGLITEPRIAKYIKKISARSLSMPLVFFDGLKVSCYVGGVGGTVYLRQAQHVADRLGMPFPPVVVWRPRDVYFGVGQVQALLIYRRLSGSFDFSEYSHIENNLREKVAEAKSKIDELEMRKKQILADSIQKKAEQVQNLKALSAKQNLIRREADFSVLVKNLGLLENVIAVMNLYPCIIDYALNVGLKRTSEQWIDFLQTNGSLSANVNLGTKFDDIEALACTSFGKT